MIPSNFKVATFNEICAESMSMMQLTESVRPLYPCPFPRALSLPAS